MAAMTCQGFWREGSEGERKEMGGPGDLFVSGATRNQTARRAEWRSQKGMGVLSEPRFLQKKEGKRKAKIKKEQSSNSKSSSYLRMGMREPASLGRPES